MTKVHFHPSWQNRLLNRIRSSKFPAAGFYVLIFLAATLLIHLGPWLEGKLPWGQLDFNLFNFLVWYLFIFLTFDYFLDYAGKASIKFKPIVDLEDENGELLNQRFTIVPAAVGWVVTVIALIFSVVVYPVMFSAEYLQIGVSRLLTILVSTFLLSFAFALVYLLLTQEVLVSRLYARVKAINIFQLGPLYVFSGLTSRIGFIMILAGILAYLTNVVFVTGEVQFTNFMFFGSTFFTLALAAFFLPSMGIHARLEEEKTRASYENDERINKVFRSLHQNVDGTGTAELADLKDQLAALLTFREEIEKISTWPWNSATLRGFLSAFFLPILLLLAESVLSKIIGS